MGLVTQVFNEKSLVSLQGSIAVGHVRYSTTGSTRWENAQPIYQTTKSGAIALAHNGNLINTEELREELLKEGNKFVSTSDTEVIVNLISYYSDFPIEKAIQKTMERLRGAYSFVLITEEKLIGVRDPYGIRPLTIGKIENGYILSSETCGLDIVGAKYVRDVEPGEIVIIDENGLFSIQALPVIKPSLCIFEFIYFARPDSILYGKNLYEARRFMGARLAELAPIEADIVAPIPDSGTPAAVGYAERSGIPFCEGLIKNRYVGRTFIQPAQTLRQLGVKMKLNPLRDLIKDKRLIIVDDSIVRGTTSKKIIEILREAGAKEVHMRISSPPVKYPCFYGIDTANRSELIASDKTVEEIGKFIGADSLAYLTFDSLVESTGRPREDFCLACFDGYYPISIPQDLKLTKFILEKSS